MRHYGLRRRGRRSFKGKNAVIHVPSTMGGTLGISLSQVIVIESPSIFAAGSASSNIEAQDKDRTVNVGHHIGRINIVVSLRNATDSGIFEFCIFKVERAETTPVLGTHPIPSSAEDQAQGVQQACRMANPGKVFHYSQRSYTIETPVTHNIVVSPAKFKLSKVKAGDHWIMIIHNRGAAAVNFDVQMRYKEYE